MPTSSSSSEPSARKSSRKRPKVDYNEDRTLDEMVAAASASAAASSASNDSYKKPRQDMSTAPAIFKGRKPLPTRSADGKLHFADHPEFTPNLTPKEVLQAGSFGGTYFRPIYSSVTKTQYDDKVWQEYPSDWFEGLNIGKQVTSKTYRPEVNRYGVKCGGDLNMWEGSGWITAIDPYGWFMWYCRFYLGRRSEDDARQIARGNQVMGPTGRFRTQLMNKCVQQNRRFDDERVSPVIRQTCQHWGYRLTEADLKAHCKKKGFKMPPS